MLEPTNRFLLSDALRPPPGYTLDIAVGTTFTLDLNALLLATMSFAAYEHFDDGGQPDPLALLESVRRHADHITVFAQAGALYGPGIHPPILSYLEHSVVPVRAPRPGHLFHPKLWAMRFVGLDGHDSQSPRYRLVNMSRNLTFDASWDTVVVLDGEAVEQPQKYMRVASDFIGGLAGLSLNPLNPRRRKAIKQFAADLRTVQWERPEPAARLRFHGLGVGVSDAPVIAGKRVLVISPFVTDKIARQLSRGPGAHVLVSRATTLDQLGGEALEGFADTFVIDVGDERDTADTDIDPPRAGHELSGLHAKVYVVEGDEHTTLWLGSANATDAAFGGNVEFMVELRLDPSHWTIDSFLDEGGRASLRNMLLPYRPVGAPQEPSLVEVSTRRLDDVLRKLAEGAYTVDVTTQERGGNTGPNSQFQLDIRWKQPSNATLRQISEQQLEVTIGPATLPPSAHVPLTDGSATITSATLQAITSFLTIEARTRVDGEEISGRTLVNARLQGEPDDRTEQLLAGLLDDPDKVLRYLLLLLADLTEDHSFAETLGASTLNFGWDATADTPALLETLLRALARSPESLQQVADFISALVTAQRSDLLPQQLTEVWDSINAVRTNMASTSTPRTLAERAVQKGEA